jgi:hypothetical protein
MEGITVSIYWMDLLASAHQGVLPGEPFREEKVASVSIVLLQDLTLKSDPQI